MDDIIQMYKQNGYKFITLTEALENPAPILSYPAAEKNVEQNAGEKFLPLELQH